MGRPPIDVNKLAARAAKAAAALNPPERQASEAIVRRASRGGPTLRAEATTGYVRAERLELPATTGGSGGGATNLDALTDVDGAAAATTGQILLKGADGIWRPGTAPAGGGDYNQTIEIYGTGVGLLTGNPATLDFKDGFALSEPTPDLVRFDLAYAGTNGTFGTATTVSRSDHGHLSNAVTDLPETVQDIVAALLTAGAGIVLTYNDAANTITIAVNPNVTQTTSYRNAPVYGYDSADKLRWWLAQGGVLSLLDAAGVIHVQLSSAGTLNLMDAAGVVAVSLSGTAASRFPVAPTVGASGSAAPVSIEGHTHTAANVTDFTEAAQDAVAAMLAAGTGVTLAYDDTANTLTITGTTGGGGTTDPEVVRDTIGVALIGAGLVAVTVNDAADTITLSTTATANSTDAQLRDRTTHTGAQAIATVTGLQGAIDAKQDVSTVAELIRDTIGTALVAGTNVTITVNDAADTITIASTWTGGDVTQGTNFRNANALWYDSANILRAWVSPAGGIYSYDAGTPSRTRAFMGNGGLYLYDAAGVQIAAIPTDGTAARFALAPTVGPSGSALPVAIAPLFAAQSADYTGLNAIGAQKVFNVSANGAVAVAAATAYLLDAVYHIHTTGATSHALQLGFGGTATLTSLGLEVHVTNTATEAQGADTAGWLSSAALTSVTTAVAAATHHTVRIRGVVRTNAAGTFIPQYGWTAAPGVAGVTLANSYLTLTPIGAGTVQTAGTWS